jgi:hypothetical protein
MQAHVWESIFSACLIQFVARAATGVGRIVLPGNRVHHVVGGQQVTVMEFHALPQFDFDRGRVGEVTEVAVV